MNERYIMVIMMVSTLVVPLCLGASFMETGHSEYLGQNYSSALQQYSRILTDSKHQNQIPEAMFMTGKCYLNLGNTEMGLKALWQLLNEFPDSEWTDDACYEVAVYKEMQGGAKLGEALMLYEMIIALHSDSERRGAAMLGAARIKQNLGYFNEANDVIAKAMATVPNLLTTAENHMSMSKIHSHPENPSRSTVKAIQHLEIVVSQFPASEYLIEAYITLGLLYLETGQRDKALGAMDAVIKKSPSVALAQLMQEKVADIYLETGQLEQAINAYKQVLADYALSRDAQQRINKQIRDLQKTNKPRVSAWHADVESDTQTVYKGGVLIDWKGATVHADNAVADFKENTITASGHLHFQWNNQIVVTCDKIVFQMREQIATLSGHVTVLRKHSQEGRHPMNPFELSLRTGKITELPKGK